MVVWAKTTNIVMKTSMNNLILLGSLVIATLNSGPLEARFLEPDADQIDQEERLSTESYNDKLSYRYPAPWDRLWEKTGTGYRVNAGSLNIKRFNFEEEIKFEGLGAGPVSFTFVQHRREDTIEARVEQVLRIDWLTPLAGLNLALLGEGGTDKQFGDLGAAIGIRPRPDRLFEVYHWSVDHFYSTKKNFPDDFRDGHTATNGVKADWQFSKSLRLQVDHQVDTPFEWNRQSRDYIYGYSRRSTDLRVDLGEDDRFSGYLTGHIEKKSEDKVFILPNDLQHEKSLMRDVKILETGIVHVDDSAIISTGLQTIHRDAAYDFSAAEGVKEADYVEDPGPERSRRREIGYFITSYDPSSTHFNTQLGLHLNQVAIDEGGSTFRETEVKLQTAWDALITAEARIFLNLTWDLDQLQKDFPYRDRDFRPWGGGNIQFLAVF